MGIAIIHRARSVSYSTSPRSRNGKDIVANSSMHVNVSLSSSSSHPVISWVNGRGERRRDGTRISDGSDLPIRVGNGAGRESGLNSVGNVAPGPLNRRLTREKEYYMY